MDIKQLSTTILRILGIYCFLNTADISQRVYSTYASSIELHTDVSQIMLIQSMPMIIMFIIGLVLTTFASTISKLIIPSSQNVKSELVLSSINIQSILFSIVGVVIVALAIPKSFNWISQLVSLASTESQSLPFNQKVVRDSWISFALSTIQLLFGFGLFFGSNTLSNIWHRLQNK
jgi:hypothetical protein